MKVSLHASGRWRMAYTAEAVAEMAGTAEDALDCACGLWLTTHRLDLNPDELTSLALGRAI